MATTISLSEYQRAARQRWPRATIYGDGAFALWCPVTQVVRLFAFAMLAQTRAADECSNWGCQNKHQVVRLQPIYQARPKLPRVWERD
jgi:hypothetical protein